ncbi:uncharacterized protein [Dendrobates tinctorius]|uniref:uncharacterized protein n=1 Tax=Dendrobates tinctorius TaxID=92724 RepID=UPI003CC942CC
MAHVNLGQNVSSSMNVPHVEAVMGQQSVLGEGSREGLMGLKKGVTPVRLAEMDRYLNKYPDIEAAVLLRDGFRDGFQIPFVDVEVKLSTKNLKSAREFPEVVTEKLNKEVALVGSISGVGTSSGTHGVGVPGGIMEPSVRAVRELLSRSLASGTWSHYSKTWRVWEDWKLRIGGGLEDESKLLLLLGHSWESGWSVPKVNNFLSGLAFGFRFRGLRDLTKSFLVLQAVRGRRRNWRASDKRCPVSYEVLLILSEHVREVCASPGEVVLLKLAFSLAFFGAFRLGELVSPCRFKKGGLLRQDVDVFGDRLEIILRSSKMDRDGRGCKVVLFEVSGSPLCPVSCMRNFGTRWGSMTDPLLVHEDGSFLSRFQFVTIFRWCLERGGISAREYSGHSFRIGAATEAASRGLGEDMVRRIGRWESVRFRSYVRPDLV